MAAMGRILWGLGLLVLMLSSARAEILTVATYNLANYTSADRMTAEGYRKDYPKPETEKQALRTVILGLNADILAVQEMGQQAYLDELRRDLKAAGLDYPYAVLLEGPDPDRHVALLARREPLAVQQHTDLAFNYRGSSEKVKRGMLEVTFRTEGGELTLFVIHLKSRLTDQPDDPLSTQRRTGEAMIVRDTILRRVGDPARACFMVLGDCNDSKRSKPLGHLLKRGKVEIATLLAAVDRHGETWTHFYRAEDSYSRVDYIMVSAALRDTVVGGTARIYDAPETQLASDHRPVMATLRLEKP